MRAGDWVRCLLGDGESYVGTLVRVLSDNSIHVRSVVNGVEAVRRCGSGAEKLTLLEVVAAESVPGYWPNPDLRVCENEDCTRILDPDWTAVYCSNRCALGDA